MQVSVHFRFPKNLYKFAATTERVVCIFLEKKIKTFNIRYEQPSFGGIVHFSPTSSLGTHSSQNAENIRVYIICIYVYIYHIHTQGAAVKIEHKLLNNSTWQHAKTVETTLLGWLLYLLSFLKLILWQRAAHKCR